MIWNGFLMGIGILLFFVVFNLIGAVASIVLERYEEKAWYKELNKYNWKNRKKKNEHIDQFDTKSMGVHCVIGVNVHINTSGICVDVQSKIHLIAD